MPLAICYSCGFGVVKKNFSLLNTWDRRWCRRTPWSKVSSRCTFFWIRDVFGSFGTIFETWCGRYYRQIQLWEIEWSSHRCTYQCLTRNGTYLSEDGRTLDPAKLGVSFLLHVTQGTVWLLVILCSFSFKSANTTPSTQIVLLSILRRALLSAKVFLYVGDGPRDWDSIGAELNFKQVLSFIDAAQAINMNSSPLFLNIILNFSLSYLFMRSTKGCSYEANWL